MLEVRFFFLCPNQCCALLRCLPNDLARQLILYGESHVVFLTHISALKKEWRPKHMCSTQVLHKLYFKSLIGTKWVCRHGAGPLHLGSSSPQCVNSLTDASEWTPQLPFSGWIFKHIPWRRRTLPLLPHVRKISPANKWPPALSFALSHSQIPQILWQVWRDIFLQWLTATH